MAQAIAKGVAKVPSAEAVLRLVPETLSPEILEKMGALEAQKSQSEIQVCTVDELAEADATGWQAYPFSILSRVIGFSVNMVFSLWFLLVNSGRLEIQTQPCTKL